MKRTSTFLMATLTPMGHAAWGPRKPYNNATGGETGATGTTGAAGGAYDSTSAKGTMTDTTHLKADSAR